MDGPVFYAPPESLSDNLIELSRAESHHAVNVLRLKLGQMVMVVDGLGTAYRGEIRAISDQGMVQVRVHLRLRNFGEPVVGLTLAAGVSAGSKFDTIVQKGTELGVKRFVPIMSAKSKVRFEDAKKATARVRRLEKVVLAAVKQCRRACCPEVAMPMALSDFLRETDRGSVNLIFHCEGSGLYLDEIMKDIAPARVSVLIGPESGFTAQEAAMAVDAGYRAVSLGSRILRTETAGPVVCALVMSLLGELR